MIVELISVGTEILLGNIVNTNAAFLSEKCAALGLSLYYQTVVGDNENRLSDAIKTALKRADIIILTGGLGPTNDDLTKETVAKVIGKKLVLHEDTKKRIESYFRHRNIVEITNNNWKQADIIEGCKVVDNHNGTAPGLIVEDNDKKIILLPGPPNEMVPMFNDKISDYLKALSGEVIYSKVVKMSGVGESRAETMVKDLINNQTNPTIAPYAKTGEVHLRVTAKASTEEEARTLIRPMINELKLRFKDSIYTTEEDETLEMAVYKLLKKHELSLVTAESCTAGLLSGRLVNVAGISEYFKCGFVTYSNKAKRKFIGVDKETLKKYGAVSEQTAKEMAKGAAKVADADVSVSITGIAGPDGGTKEKPVGLVYIACNVKGKVTVRKEIFSGNREKIRESSVMSALELLRRCILLYN